MLFSRKIYWWLLTICLFPQAASAQMYAAALIPDSLRTNANVVIRRAESVFEVKNTQQAVWQQTLVVTILKPEGKAMRQLYAFENEFEKVKTLSAQVFSAEGKLVRESEKTAVQNFNNADVQAFGNSQVKFLEMDHNLLPYTIEFRLVKEIKGFLFVPEFDIQKLGQAVQFATYTFISPADYQFQWKGINTTLQPTRQRSGDVITTIWKTKDLCAPAVEPSNPYFNAVFSQIIFAPERVRIDDYQGVMKNWTEVGQFFYDLNKDRDNLSPAMREKVQQLTTGLSSNREKVAVLYRYLQQNHRYVSIQIGVGGWQTFDADFVEKKKYGDCKALSNYMKALLKAADIPAYQALVYAGDDGAPEVYDDLPAPAFNHVILYLPGENSWLECTSTNDPPGYLGEFTADRKVLLITPQGGKLVRTPALTAVQNTQTSRCDVILNETGGATVHNHIRSTGHQQEYGRYAALKQSKAENEADFFKTLGFSITKLHALNFTASEDEPVVTLDYNLEASTYAICSGKRMFVPLTKTNPLKRTLPPVDHRVLDLKIASSYNFRDTIVLHFPAGSYTAESIPTGKKVVSEFGVFELQIEKSADFITVIRAVEMRPVSVPASRYEEVRKFFQEVTKADGAQMVLVKKE